MNKDKRNNIKLLGTLNNADESGIIANANQIYDANEDKSTQDVSKEHKERIKTLETKENSMQTTLENITKTGEASAASNVTYNHSDSKLDATNVQQAIDEVNSISHFAKRGGIVNISTNYNTDHTIETLTLEQAIAKVPSSDRVLGFQGKYLATDGWHTIIYTGDNITSWSDTTKWIDLPDKILRSISKNALFAGIATPTTDPGTPDGHVFYIATEAGTYSNFNGISVSDGEIAILEWEGSWVKKDTGFAIQQQVVRLEENLEVIENELNGISEKIVYTDTFTNAGYYTSNGTLNSNASLNTATYAIANIQKGQIVDIHVFGVAGNMSLVSLNSDGTTKEVIEVYKVSGYNDIQFVADEDTILAISTWKPGTNKDFYYSISTTSSLSYQDLKDKVKNNEVRIEVLENKNSIRELHAYASGNYLDDSEISFYGKDLNNVNAIQRAIWSTNRDGKRTIIHCHGIFKSSTKEEFILSNTELDTVAYHSVVSLLGYPNITLKGDGKNETYIIGELPDGSTEKTIYQTLQLEADGLICEDMTITAKNCRYPVHIDKNSKSYMIDSRQTFNRCKIVHFGGGSGHAIGLGLAPGQVVEVNNSEVYSSTSAAYYHDGGNKDLGHRQVLRFNNCKLTSINEQLAQVQIQANTVAEIIEFNNCIFSCGVNAILIEDSRSNRGTSFDYRKYCRGNILGACNMPAKYGFYKDGMRMLKIEANNEEIEVLFDKTSSVYELLIKGIDIQDNVTSDGIIYSDSYMRRIGWAMGLKVISIPMEGSPYFSIKDILGDCSASNKTLGIYFGESLVNVVFDKDYSSYTDEQIISEINSQISDVGKATLSSENWEIYKNFDDSFIECENTSPNFIKKGACVKKYLNGVIKANGGPIFGIALQSIPPGKRGLVLVKGIIGKKSEEPFGVDYDGTFVRAKRYSTDNSNNIIEKEYGELIAINSSNVMIGY